MHQVCQMKKIVAKHTNLDKMFYIQARTNVQIAVDALQYNAAQDPLGFLLKVMV